MSRANRANAIVLAVVFVVLSICIAATGLIGSYR